jgi:nicotinic acid mononucleotide adenylyltransferase
MLQVSSTFIRERIRKNGPFRHFLSPAVSDFIEKTLLYQV